MNIPKDHPTLILMRGLPGGGKTYLTETLVNELGASNVVVLDPDKIDQASAAYQAHSAKLSQDGVDTIYHPHRWSRAKAYDAIVANKIIMWNQPFTSLGGFTRTINSLVDHAKNNHKALPILVVEVAVDPEIAKQRIADRVRQGGHGPSAGRFARFVDEYRSFANLGYPTITVQGQDDVQISAAAVLQALRQLWE